MDSARDILKKIQRLELKTRMAGYTAPIPTCHSERSSRRAQAGGNGVEETLTIGGRRRRLGACAISPTASAREKLEVLRLRSAPLRMTGFFS